MPSALNEYGPVIELYTFLVQDDHHLVNLDFLHTMDTEIIIPRGQQRHETFPLVVKKIRAELQSVLPPTCC
eukprot:1158092-Pelagomonas_calceolata.AAC.4